MGSFGKLLVAYEQKLSGPLTAPIEEVFLALGG